MGVMGDFKHKLQVEMVIAQSPTNLLWCHCHKTRLITLSCGVQMSAVCSFVSSQSTRVIDGQTDGQTDGQNYDPKTALA